MSYLNLILSIEIFVEVEGVVLLDVVVIKQVVAIIRLFVGWLSVFGRLGNDNRLGKVEQLLGAYLYGREGAEEEAVVVVVAIA